MAVISLISAKGSPGVTTAAAALATAAVCTNRPAWWVELDPSGGSGWLRARGTCRDSEPTLADVARDLREEAAGEDWVGLAVQAPPGVPAVLAPTSGLATSTVIGEGPSRWSEQLRAPGTVVVDCGRWDRTQPTASRMVGSDLVCVVCRSTLESIEHARKWVGGVREVARCPVAVLVVGTTPYSGDEVAEALSLPLAGVLEWRQADVGALWARGASKQVLRSWLGRSATRSFASVQGIVDAREAASGPSLVDVLGAEREGRLVNRLDRP